MHKDKKASLKRNIFIVGALVALILILDQWIKIYVKSNFEIGDNYPILGDWFKMTYTENPGMAFGTTFGTQAWHKLALSIFRVIAISALSYYWIKQAKASMKTEFLVALGLIIAGATGNLIDSMTYDYLFAFDPCHPFNIMEGSGIFVECSFWGQMETRPHGFLLGNVVDMFEFVATWPKSLPLIGGEPVFPAVWNVADASITVGVAMVFIRQRKYFPKKKEDDSTKVSDSQEEN